AGNVALEQVSIAGLNLEVRKGKDGRMNFDDLAGPGREPGAEARPERGERGPAPRFAVGRLSIDRGRIAYRDEASGQDLVIEGLNAKLGPLEGGAASPLSLALSIAGHRPEVAMKVAVSGEARLDSARGAFAVSKFDARVGGSAATMKGLDLRLTGNLAAGAGRIEVNQLALAASGTFDRDAMTASLRAPSISVAPDKASGAAVEGRFRLAGPQGSLEARLDMAAIEGTASALSIPEIALVLDAARQGRRIAGRVATPVKASLAAGTWELPRLAADLGVSAPGKARAQVNLQASVKADLRRQNLAVDAQAKLDGQDAKLKVSATRFAPLDASFDLDAQRLNLDDFLPPKKDEPARPDEPIELAALIGPRVTGKVRIGALRVSNVALSDLRAELKLAGGRLELAPHSAGLYQGTLSGALAVEARGNRISLRETVQGVQINPLLRDLADKDILEGKGDVTLELNAAGATVAQMKRSLAGTARVVLKDGAYKGINLAESFRKVSGVLGARGTASPGERSQKTDFSEASASFAIKGGVAHNEDLSMKSPFVRVAGSGDLDIGNSTVNYIAKASLVATATGQQGRDDAAGITLPVRIHGPFAAVKYDVDYGALVGATGLDRLGSRLGGILGGRTGGDAKAGAPSAVDGVKDRLKGLFGR
ncbi:MAG: AsmA family protein, partial [Burkholderiales bacterium]|nr:AsmA family protein [Burkholderiales bacterium]